MDKNLKTCPKCYHQIAITDKFCPECGYQFYDDNEMKITFDLVNYPFYKRYFQNIDSLIDYALYEYSYSNYHQALESIENFLLLHPDNAKIWSLKAYILYKLKYYDDAFYCCDVSLNIDDLFDFTWLTRAIILINLNQKKAALLSFDEFLVLNHEYDSLYELKEYVNSIFKTDIKSIDFKPNDYYNFENDYENKISDMEELLSKDSLNKIKSYNLTMFEYNEILDKISETSNSILNKLIRNNFLEVGSLSILEKILLYAKSFVEIEFTSNIEDTGIYDLNHIKINDKSFKSEQISTIIHELAHHVLAEIFEQIFMKLLKCQKSIEIEILVAYILVSTTEIKLIDEYCAHTVEGRFIPYGYQSYGSLNQIINHELDKEKDQYLINNAKIFGSIVCEDIYKLFEEYINENLRDEIKGQFIKDNMNQNLTKSPVIDTQFNNENKINIINNFIKNNFEKCFYNPNELIMQYNLFMEKQ